MKNNICRNWKTRIIPFVIIFCSIIFIRDTRAQSPGILIGPIGGVNLVSYQTAEFGISNTEPTKWTAQNGSGTDPFWGLSLLFPISRPSNPYFLVVEGLYDSKSAAFTTFSSGAAESAELSYILLNIGVKHNFFSSSMPSGLGLQVCLSLGYRYEANLHQVYDSTAFPNQYPEGVTTIESATDADELRIAIRAEATYDIPLYSNPGIVLTPAVGYDEPLTQVDPDNNWTASSLYFSLSLRFLLFQKAGGANI